MAPRANWKGFLRLSLVTCPIALFPATSESEKISFNQINKKTGHRIKYQKVDADTGEEVASDNIINDLYLVRPYYIVPDGKVGHDAYAVIWETIRSLDKVALARVVLTNREHVIALQARDKGLMGTLLRYPYEVRADSEYFDDIQDVKITKDMLDLAKHIVEQKSGHFEPDKFEDHYEAALQDLLNKKQKGLPITKAARPTGDNVVDLMSALRASLKRDKRPETTAPAKKPKAKAKSNAKRKAG